MDKIRLHGELKENLGDRDDLYLIGDYRESFGAPIATEDEYKNFNPSTAHCNEDGTIMRHMRVIGSIEDIEIVK